MATAPTSQIDNKTSFLYRGNPSERHILGHKMTFEATQLNSAHFKELAAALVNARLTNNALSVFPGEKPTSLDAAYAIQNIGIEIWPSPVVGWKVGGIGGEHAKVHGANRLVGPVFFEKLWTIPNAPAEIGVFDGGFD